MTGTKPCIACKEPILENALKCKHCHQIQTATANLHNHRWFQVAAVTLLGLFILWIVYYIISFYLEEPIKPTFETGPGEIGLTDSEEGLKVRCIANIKNPSIKRWDAFSLQAVFRNKGGDKVDVHYANPEITLYPLFHFDSIVSGSANAEKEEYSSCEVTVVNAHDY